ncbi:hypothetical protein IFM89_021120 [Coptis chinensis]|uniref:ZFYVE26-like TPR repeats domain-containing protein n=1 Tax=Coptis chinensis TaxID=261450 RepID=A0A835HNK2_9MAGN|nr:hypothetical protein IFM89_021120 [Coptis chinensis]
MTSRSRTGSEVGHHAMAFNRDTSVHMLQHLSSLSYSPVSLFWEFFYRKVLACVVCGRLKSAFQIASRSGSVADVQYVAHQVFFLTINCYCAIAHYNFKSIGGLKSIGGTAMN